MICEGEGAGERVALGRGLEEAVVGGFLMCEVNEAVLWCYKKLQGYHLAT